MSILSALAWFIADILAFFWYSVFAPATNEPDEADNANPPERAAGTFRVDDAPPPVLSPAREHGILIPSMYRRDADLAMEGLVNESSFLSQLEQRTQQVKITLANLEADKVRIEGLIAQLQPVVPHYDALLEAERAISTANIAIEAAHAAPAAEAQPEQTWEQQHEP